MRGMILAVILACAGCGFHPPPGTPLTWYDERWGNVTEQELDNSCGLASLRTIAYYHFGHEISERELLTRYVETQSNEAIARAMKEGVSLLELEHLAQSFDYQTRRSMLSIDELARVVSFAPVIVYLEVDRFRHFAVVRGMSKTEVLLADSSRGNVRYSREAFLAEWKVPEEFHDRWKTPGGLVLFKNGNEHEHVSTFLKTLDSRTPESFFTLKRSLMLGR